MKEVGRKKENKAEGRFAFLKSKIFWVFVICVLAIILIWIGTNFYLFYNYIVGNDVILTITPSDEHLFLHHNEEAVVSFESSVIANPFCAVSCSYEFLDLSSGEVIDTGSFSLKSYSDRKKEYSIFSPSYGIGQQIFRYDMQCIGVRSTLCYTTGEITQKNAIVTLNYNLTSEEERTQDILRRDYMLLSERMHLVSQNLDNIETHIHEQSHITFHKELLALDALRSELFVVNQSLTTFYHLWEEQDLLRLSESLDGVSHNLSVIESELSLLLTSFVFDMQRYNNLSSDITTVLTFFDDIYMSSMTAEQKNSAEVLLDSFESYLVLLYNKSFVSTKVALFQPIYTNYTDLLFALGNDTFSIKDSVFDRKLNTSVPVPVTHIDFFVITDSFARSLPEMYGTCCVGGACMSCCDDSCASREDIYPIVFLHGHDFSESVSPEANLNIFSSLQRELEDTKDIYNFGSFVFNDPSHIASGLWGKLPHRISIRSSYYFETGAFQDRVSIFQAKKNNIDTYAIRLHDLITTITKKTGREKVIIVSHSMGGLVTRRYLQIFGEDQVSQVIFIAAPHHGVSGNIERYCGLFGSEAECDDMKRDSLFLKKLELAEVPSIESHNIIGIGCSMGDETGDGIVENSSAYLSWAQNHYIAGTCSDFGFVYLHNDIVDPTQYPEVSVLLADLVS